MINVNIEKNLKDWQILEDNEVIIRAKRPKWYSSEIENKKCFCSSTIIYSTELSFSKNDYSFIIEQYSYYKTRIDKTTSIFFQTSCYLDCYSNRQYHIFLRKMIFFEKPLVKNVF